MGVKLREINLVLLQRPVCESLKKWGESRWEATEEVQVDGERGWSMALSSPLPDSSTLAARSCCPGPSCSAWASTLAKDRGLLMRPACGAFSP